MASDQPTSPARQAGPAPTGDFIALATVALGTIMLIAVVAILFFVREILIPVSLAVLLSFVLAPAVSFLQHWHLPRAAAAIVSVLAAVAIMLGLGTVLVGGVRDLAKDLPRYEGVLRQKIQVLRGLTAGSASMDQAASMIEDLGKELKGGDRARTAPAASNDKPVPVVVKEEGGPLAMLTTFVSPLLNPLATTGVVVVFVIFILLQKEDLRDRLIRLTGTRDLGRTTAAINDAARRLSRLYLMQLALNGGFGLCIGFGVWLIGVPGFATWGILAAVLRFVPYVGAIISAVLPFALALAVEPGWRMAIETAALFLVAETLVGQILEPLIYGHSTGLSPVAVVIAATFWTWLWGPIGLVLATPLTVCLVVLGRHVERLQFLDVMLGDRPALSPPEMFYQRMLASDPVEATDQAELFLKERSLLTYYDGVVLEGLKLAQDDLSHGLLDRDQLARIRASAEEVVLELENAEDVEPSGGPAILDAEAEAAVEATRNKDLDPAPSLGPDELPADWREKAVLCAAGQSDLDAAAAAILAQLLRKHGLPADALPSDALRTAQLARLDLSAARFVCLCLMDGSNVSRTRQAVRKLRRKAPNATLVVAALTRGAETAQALQAETAVTDVVQTLPAALTAAVTAAKRAAAVGAPADAAMRSAPEPQPAQAG